MKHSYPVSDILRTIDAMSFVKVRISLPRRIHTILTGAFQLNVLYWHVIDSQSFPLHVQAYPELAEKGAYSADEIYSQDDIQTIVQYANEVTLS